MKIAMISNISERVPPKKYGGTERVVAALTEELVKRGHEVTLFASGDSLTSANLVSVFPRGLRESKVNDPYGLSPQRFDNLAQAYTRQAEFDIIHDHNWIINLPTANIATTPTLITLHGAFDVNNRHLFESIQNISYVAISHAQTIPLPNLPYAGIVHNGLAMDTYPFSEEHDNYLLYVGRIAMEKGVHHAIDVAQYLHMPLIMAAKVDPVDMPYFHEYIEPRLTEDIRWIGEVTDEERNTLMSRALCFLHPVNFREPFGLTLIEAMACGCPIVAFKRGSIPEVIKNGITGFVVEDVDEMILAVAKIDQIKREACRAHSLANFNAKKMTDGYEKMYEKILTQKGKKKEKDNHVSTTIPHFPLAQKQIAAE